MSTPVVSNVVQSGSSVMQDGEGLFLVARGPLEDAIGRLFTVLQTIKTNTRNKEDIFSFRVRLRRLSWLLNTPTAEVHLEESRRDEFIRVLEDTSDQLKKLGKRFLGYRSIPQTITRCSIELNSYLQEIRFERQIQTQYKSVELDEIGHKSKGAVATDLPGTVPLRCVVLADATGREHTIPTEFCKSLEQLSSIVKAMFALDSSATCIERQFVEQGDYDLCIDQRKQDTKLTIQAGEWSGTGTRTKITIRAIITKEVLSSSALKCHTCGSSDLSIRSRGMVRMDDWTIFCQRCGRQDLMFQTKERTSIGNGPTVSGRATEPVIMQDFRDIQIGETSQQRVLLEFLRSERLRRVLERLRELRVHHFVVRGPYAILTESLPPPALSGENCCC